MNKLFKKSVYSIIAISLVIILFLHFAPINFDAGSCSGGYKKFLIDSNSTLFLNMFIDKNNSLDESKYKLISSNEEIINSTSWNNRIVEITLKFNIDGHGNYIVKYEGKRYWINKYNWKITSINT